MPLLVPLPTLAKQTIPDVSPTLGDEGPDQIAELARLIDQEERTRGGMLDSQVPYHELPKRQRLALRVSVIRVVQAMVMLGYIEP